MHQKHEAQAVSVASSLILTAIRVLAFSGESVGIGIRTDCERSLQRLGPDHKPMPLSDESLRSLLVDSGGEEFAVDVFDNNAPQARAPESDNDKRLAELEKRFQEQAEEQRAENARLRAELEAAKAPKSPKDKEPAKDAPKS